MKRRYTDAHVIPFPAYQRLAAAAYRTQHDRPTIHGLVEVDVTEPRALIRQHKARTGKALSFTAFLVCCLGKAVDEDKSVQVFRQGTKQLVVFDDVDVATRIEREVDGHKYVVSHVLRAVNHKSVRALHDEIRSAQVAEVHNALTRLRFLPSVLDRIVASGFAWVARSHPRLWKDTMGTVGLTSIGMFGTGAGWGIPLPSPTALMVTVGGIGEKPVLVGGQVVAREHLSLTISVDHSVVDGAPAARFTQHLKGTDRSRLRSRRPARP